jgi:hypothetical protein
MVMLLSTRSSPTLGGLEMTRSDAGDAAFRLCRSSEVIRSCPHDDLFLGVLRASRMSLDRDCSGEHSKSWGGVDVVGVGSGLTGRGLAWCRSWCGG